MNGISLVTGSRLKSDNFTYLYVFCLGIPVGTYYAMGFIHLDPTGHLLQIYLPVVTGMLGGAVGFASSRVGDRITDRRTRHRKILSLRINLRNVWMSMATLGNTIQEVAKSAPATFDPSGSWLTFHQATRLLIDLARIQKALAKELNFETIADTFNDMNEAQRVTISLEGISDFFAGRHFNGLTLIERQKEAAILFHSHTQDVLADSIKEFIDYENYFARISEAL